MKRTSSISKFLRPLAEATTQTYLTNELQVADVLEWILDQVGRAEIIQTSFSISEEFLRRLYFMVKDREIDGITLVLDLKATQKTLKLWAFIEQVIQKTYLADNHSKIILVKGGHCQVAVITSQNLTRGNRQESTVVTTDPEIFSTLFDSVHDLITNHSVPLHDLFRERITAD